MSSQLQSSNPADVDDKMRKKNEKRLIKICQHVKSISNTLSRLVNQIDERRSQRSSPQGQVKRQVYSMFRIEDEAENHELLFPGIIQRTLLSFAAKKYKRLVG